MKKITIGIIAHVDSGKTTLSEALLYLTGTIRNFGRVDKGASFLDNDSMERRRGITIYSKQARFSYGDTQFVLIDTPGHADFSAEMERSLQVLDYAVLLISAADGVRGRTQQLFRLLQQYGIPIFVFFNKMDQDGADRQALMNSFRASVSSDAVDFTQGIFALTDPDHPDLPEDAEANDFYDALAMCSEEAMETYLENGCVPVEMIRQMISKRQLFPCFFGSALRQEGIRGLLNALDMLTSEPVYPEEFGARVYKILRDPDGSRLTFMKITGGSLKTKTLLPDSGAHAAADSTSGAASAAPDDGGSEKQENPAALSKINQLRLYNGNKYELADEVKAGEICAAVGLKESFAGQGFGTESGIVSALMTPVLSYRVILPENLDPVKAYPYFKLLEEENPELQVVWNEQHAQISVCVMGKVQTEVLSASVKERFGFEISFDAGQVMYRETIAKPVIGAGHFEPLRHYAEAVLLMQPMPRGTGLLFDSAVRTERLAKNWQRLILTHLEEKQHRGVLTGSAITDMKITVIAGKSHLKHTEGGDFRQAVYRAVRQGLMMAENILLEPYYRFILEVPLGLIGRSMTDLDRIGAQFSAPETGEDPSASVLTGRAPVSAIRDYPLELAAYSKGAGSITFFNDGYDICRNSGEIILQKGYDPLSDVRNTPDSVFCANGSGYIVPYHEVYSMLDVSPSEFLESIEDAADEASMQSDGAGSGRFSDISKALESAKEAGLKEAPAAKVRSASNAVSIGTKEIDEIIAKISRSNSRDKKPDNTWKRKFGTQSSAPAVKADVSSRVFAIEDADYIVVDGYNVIFAWPELSDLARVNIDSARDALIDILSRLQSMSKGKVTVVFDAYRIKGHAQEHMKLQNVELIFTAEEETADQYIEKFTNINSRKCRIVVVTSDGLEQLITRGQGCMLISSRDLRSHIDSLSAGLREKYGVK